MISFNSEFFYINMKIFLSFVCILGLYYLLDKIIIFGSKWTKLGKTNPTWLTGVVHRDCILFWELAPSTLTDNWIKTIFVTHGMMEGGGGSLITEIYLTKSLTHLWPQGCRQTLAWLSKHIVQESSLTLIRRNNSNCKCLQHV